MREIAHQHTRLRANWTQANRHAGGSNTVVVAATELASASSQIDRHSHTKTSLIGARRYRQRRRRRDASWLHTSCVRSYRPKLALVPPSMTEITEVISCRSMAFPEHDGKDSDLQDIGAHYVKGHDPKITLSRDKSFFRSIAVTSSPLPLSRFLT